MKQIAGLFFFSSRMSMNVVRVFRLLVRNSSIILQCVGNYIAILIQVSKSIDASLFDVLNS